MSDDPKKPLSPEEATKRIRKAAREGNVKFAEQTQIEREELQPYKDKILDALGIKNAWMSDQSTLSDFGQDKAKILEKIGLEDDGDYTMWRLAERLYLKDQS